MGHRPPPRRSGFQQRALWPTAANCPWSIRAPVWIKNGLPLSRNFHVMPQESFCEHSNDFKRTFASEAAPKRNIYCLRCEVRCWIDK